MSIVSRIFTKIKRSRNPVRYWRESGLKFSGEGKGIEIYSTANLGSEPYLIEIGDNVRICDGVQLITHDGGAFVLRNYLDEEDSKKIDIFGKIKIGNNVHIGTNSIIMPGVIIGDNCIIGCSAVVTKNIPSGSVAAGVPARVIKTIDEYAEKNKPRFLYTKGMNAIDKRGFVEKNI